MQNIEGCAGCTDTEPHAWEDIERGMRPGKFNLASPRAARKPDAGGRVASVKNNDRELSKRP